LDVEGYKFYYVCIKWHCIWQFFTLTKSSNTTDWMGHNIKWPMFRLNSFLLVSILTYFIDCYGLKHYLQSFILFYLCREFYFLEFPTNTLKFDVNTCILIKWHILTFPSMLPSKKDNYPDLQSAPNNDSND
jgi:hypothetical protein